MNYILGTKCYVYNYIYEYFIINLFNSYTTCPKKIHPFVYLFPSDYHLHSIIIIMLCSFYLIWDVSLYIAMNTDQIVKYIGFYFYFWLVFLIIVS